jgi:hypothetical protein
MRLPRTDPHLRPEPIPEPVAEPRARVPEHPCRIASLHEHARVPLVLGNDSLGVARAVLVDVGDGSGEGRDSSHGEGWGEVLRVVGFGS